MSAFLCNSTHIALLAVYCARKNNHWGTAKKVAAILAKENIRSVEARYNDISDAASEFVGSTNAAYIAECQAKTQDPSVELFTLTPGRLFGMAQCSEYQSCETDDYLSTQACEILNFICKSAATTIFEQARQEVGWEFDAADLPVTNARRLF